MIQRNRVPKIKNILKNIINSRIDCSVNASKENKKRNSRMPKDKETEKIHKHIQLQPTNHLKIVSMKQNIRLISKESKL